MSRSKSNSNIKRTDRQKLELFVKKVEELGNTNLGRKGFSPGYHIEARRGEPATFSIKQPDEADLKEFLITFRQFISEDEDIFLNRIFNICQKCLNDTDAKDYLAKARQDFKEMKEHNGLNFIENNVKFSPVDVTDIYINGIYFHNDLEYQTKLDNMDSLTSGVFRYYFLSYVHSVTKLIIYMWGMVTRAFEVNDFTFQES